MSQGHRGNEEHTTAYQEGQMHDFQWERQLNDDRGMYSTKCMNTQTEWQQRRT